MRKRWLGAALAVMAGAALAPLTGAQAKTTADAFADAAPLAPLSYTYGNTVGNTLESGEPQPCGQIGATTWYRIDDPPVGTAIGLHVGGNFDTVVAVYTGPSLAELETVACDDDSGSDSGSALVFVPEQPTTYWVQLGGFGSKSGNFYMEVSQPPANDEMAHATDASDGFDSVIDTEGATWSASEPPPCNPYSRYTLWYQVAAPIDTEVVVALDEPLSEWGVDVFEAKPDGTLASRGCQRTEYNGDGFDPVRLRVPVQAGTTLLVRVADYAWTEVRLRIAPMHLAKYQHPYDRPDTAKPIPSLPFHDNTDTTFATLAGEPKTCSLPTATVWYRFTPKVPTPVLAHTVGSDFDTIIGVFRQDANGLTEVACNDDVSPRSLLFYDSAVRFVADAGVTYFFQVGGFDGRSGVLSLDVAGVAP